MPTPHSGHIGHEVAMGSNFSCVDLVQRRAQVGRVLGGPVPRVLWNSSLGTVLRVRMSGPRAVRA